MTDIQRTDRCFLEAFSREIIPGTVTILGCPLDMTTTYRSGTKAGPAAIRAASDSIETYSPFTDADILDTPFSDVGDIPLSSDSVEQNLDTIRRRVSRILSAQCKPLTLGGEHTISFPVVRELAQKIPGLTIIQADAHADLRDEYEGDYTNHATVMRRISEVVGPDRIIQVGIRSGTREEFQWMSDYQTRAQWGAGHEVTLMKRLSGRPVYLTFDLDVLDPSCLSGTGNPEPGGLFYRDVEWLFGVLRRCNLVGADVVELSPGLDASGVSAITAAKIVRELIVLLSVA